MEIAYEEMKDNPDYQREILERNERMFTLLAACFRKGREELGQPKIKGCAAKPAKTD